MKNKFALKLSLQSIRHFKGRIILVLLGVLLALSLLVANTIWEDTSEVLILEELDENTDYLVSSSSFLPNTVYEIAEYIPQDELVERFDVSILSNAIFNVKNKSGDYRYFPINAQQNPDDPVAVSNAISTNLEAMIPLSHILRIDGSFPTASDETMISKEMAMELENLLEIEIEPGAIIDVGIGKRFPFTDQGETQLKHFDMSKFSEITITGIFEPNGAESLTAEIYSSLVFDRLLIFPLTEDNFSADDLVLMDSNSIIANLMIKFTREAILDAGIEDLDQFVFDFQERLQSRFWYGIGDTQIKTIRELQSEFRFAFNAAYLYFPLALLSLLLSHYTIGLLIKGREDQFELLKLRGATDLEIVRSLAFEFIIVAITALLVGTPLAIIFATLIPGLRPNGTIDFEIATAFLNKLQINFTSLYQINLIILAVFISSASYHLFTFVYNFQNEEKTDTAKILYVGRVIATLLLTGFLGLLIYDLREFISLTTISFDPQIGIELVIAILVLCVLWLLYSQFITDLVFFLLGKAYTLYITIIPSIGFYINKNILRKRSLTKVLVFYLIFMFSVLIFASSLYTTYDVYNHQSDEYLQGADLRIHTEDTKMDFKENLSRIEGINTISPIYRGIGFIATTEYTVYAVDPATFAEVGYWDYTTADSDPREIIGNLGQNDSGMIISDRMSKRLGFQVGAEVLLSSFEGTYVTPFNVVGILDSAPGLGLSGYNNPELNQNNAGWVMISLPYANSTFQLDDTELFLGSIQEGYSPSQVSEQLKTMEAIEFVNPHPVNQNFVGAYVGEFLPFPRAILLFSAIITMAISVIMMFLLVNYLLRKRQKEYALLMAIGGKREQVNRIIQGELLLATGFAIIFGTVFGLVISQLALLFFIPFTLKKLLVPIILRPNYWLYVGISIVWILEMSFVIVLNRKNVLPEDITGILLDRRS